MNLSDESTLVDLLNACASGEYPDKGFSPIHPILTLQTAVGDLTRLLTDAWSRQKISSCGIIHTMSVEEIMRGGWCVARILWSAAQVAFELGLTLGECMNPGQDDV